MSSIKTKKSAKKPPKITQVENLKKTILNLKKELAQTKLNDKVFLESKYQALFEMSDDAILVIEDNKFVECNKAVLKMLGYKNKEELLNTHPSELSPLKQPDGRFSHEKAEEMMRLAIKNGSHHFEWIHTKSNGENFPVEVWLCKVKHNKKILINTIWRDLTEKKKAEETILKNITEKEILLKEIHHRVKNNMQIICSLINLQTSTLNDSKLKSILFQCKSRVESMAKIHEMLYLTKDFTRINFNDYVQELSYSLINNIEGNIGKISVKKEIENIYFSVNTAIPLALLINEIITNSLKHAFSSKTNGFIYVKIAALKSPKFILKIGDNGKGSMHSIFDIKNDSLGFQIIQSLCSQLNGKIKKENLSKGTHYEIVFEQLSN